MLRAVHRACSHRSRHRPCWNTRQRMHVLHIVGWRKWWSTILKGMVSSAGLNSGSYLIHLGGNSSFFKVALSSFFKCFLHKPPFGNGPWIIVNLLNNFFEPFRFPPFLSKPCDPSTTRICWKFVICIFLKMCLLTCCCHQGHHTRLDVYMPRWVCRRGQSPFR